MQRAIPCIVALVIGLSTDRASAQWVTFVNETGTRLIADAAAGSANPDEKDYAFGDLDQDGDIDLVAVYKQLGTTRGKRANRLFMNEGGILVDRTADLATHSTVILNSGPSQGFLDLTNDRDVQIADLNGDGWLDVVTATTLSGGAGGSTGEKAISHPRIYINRGNDGGGNWLGLTFDDENRVPTMPAEPRFCSVSVGDIDGVNGPDLYFGDYEQGGDRDVDLNDRLWINDGTGYFTDESSTRMSTTMLESSFGMSTVIADMNGDGRLDILKDDALNAPQGVSISYNNSSGAGTLGFFDEYEIVYGNSPYHINTGDLNNDGLLDIIITDDGQDFYILNQGNGADGLANFGPRRALIGSVPEFGGDNYIIDLNNDGFGDVLIANVDVDLPSCSTTGKIYRNLGGPPGSDVTLTLANPPGIAPSDLVGVHDYAVFDINGDGWKDIVIGRCTGTSVYISQPPVGLTFSYPEGLPSFVTPGEAFSFQVQVGSFGGLPEQESGELHVSVAGGPFSSSPMTVVGDPTSNLYLATLPAADCPEGIAFYVSASLQGGATATDPPSAPAETFAATAAAGVVEFASYDFEDPDGGAGWTVVNDPSLTTGGWEVADPIGTINAGAQAAPSGDAEASADSVMAFVTQNGLPGGAAGTADVDSGPTTLSSPPFDLAGTDALISYFRWYYSSGSDPLVVSITNDGGQNWVEVESVTTNADDEWVAAAFQVSNFVTPTADMQVRFAIADSPNNSITEAGLDLFVVNTFDCGVSPCACTSDLNADSDRNGLDVAGFIDCFLGGGANCACADIDGSGALDMADVSDFVDELIASSACP